LTSTAWSKPVPSRMTTKATLPEDRTCVTQPRTRTLWPECDGSFDIRE
jgi:hypothetical protein